MKRFFPFFAASLVIFLAGCELSLNLNHAPPPGWRQPVYPLVLTTKSFPPGWQEGYEIPDYVKDPSTNHVTMEWVNIDGEGLVYESIWRAYTNEDAKTKYNELRETRFGPSRTLTPDIKYVPFEPPTEIKYHSGRADDFYTACGWLETASCITVARYQNYVVALTADLRGSLGNDVQQKGLSYSEIEAVVKDLDTTFVDFLNSVAK